MRTYVKRARGEVEFIRHILSGNKISVLELAELKKEREEALANQDFSHFDIHASVGDEPSPVLGTQTIGAYKGLRRFKWVEGEGLGG
jgi:hypothetical protein